MRNLRDLLDIKLLSQPFSATLKPKFQLEDGKAVAQLYSSLEQCISVLSDLKTRRSYVYYGAVAHQIGLVEKDIEIDSIWEDELFNLIHTDDLQRKFRLELQFFQFLNSVEITKRSNYEVITKLRVRSASGSYIVLKHRLLYLSSLEDGSAWLALCLYHNIPDHQGFSIPDGVIINNENGTAILSEQDTFTALLSIREKEILQLIKHGYKSKDIAFKLALSVNTVNRHRQNIFQKLNVTNSMEACRIAEVAGLL